MIIHIEVRRRAKVGFIFPWFEKIAGFLKIFKPFFLKAFPERPLPKAFDEGYSIVIDNGKNFV